MDVIGKNIIKEKKFYENSFYVVNLTEKLQEKIQDWNSNLPRVKPFYAVKCNTDQKLLQHLMKNGVAFDCASRREIDLVLSLGCDINNIIFAHPIKKIDDIHYTHDIGIKYTTFDNPSELDKLIQYGYGDAFDTMKCIIRICIDNPTARIQLGLKYGVKPNEYKNLLDYAKKIGIDIVGVSFHVGGAGSDCNIFETAISYAKEVFEYATNTCGFSNMHILDIGGGFINANFAECASVINNALETYFPEDMNEDLKIIAEPGRYFAEEVFTFFTPIIGVRNRNQLMEYWIADSLYGSFNCIIYDGQNPVFKPIENPLLHQTWGIFKREPNEILHPSKIMGCTCDSFDKIDQVFHFPELQLGDYFMCENFGAYTHSGAMNFNGIEMTDIPFFYI